MTATTKKAIEAAVHNLAVAGKAERDATLAKVSAVVALRDAEATERARRAEYTQAALDLAGARAAAWVEDHPGDLATVQAGTDFARLARLRLGKKGSDGYYKAAWFAYNDLGTAVRRIVGK